VTDTWLVIALLVIVTLALIAVVVTYQPPSLFPSNAGAIGTGV
jgi:hypothetical protein